MWTRIHAVQPIWFVVALAAEAFAYVGYVLSYREVSRVEEGPEMPVRDALAAVTAGFGAFVAQGGFAVDLHAFRARGSPIARRACASSGSGRSSTRARAGDVHRGDHAALDGRRQAGARP